MTGKRPMGAVARLCILLFATTAYVAFLAEFVYFILWSLNLFVPQTIDSAALLPLASSSVSAALIDLALIALFAQQHTVMARPAFKEKLLRFLPKSVERAIYVFASDLVFAAILIFWQPVPEMIWNATGLIGEVLLAFSLLSWLFAVAATFMINHFELFGLQQAWQNLRARAITHPDFVIRFGYRFVRHPLMTGILLGLWVVPQMSIGHAVLSIGFTLYILVGTSFEEQDLEDVFGDRYRDYQAAVPKLFPSLSRRDHR